MEEKLKYILNEEKKKQRQKTKNYTSNSYTHSLKKLKRYDSAVFYMQNKKIIGLKESLPIKNIQFDVPKKESSPNKLEGRKITKYRTKLLSLNKSNVPLNKNQFIKNILIFNKIRSKNILIKNKILKPFIATIQNNFFEQEKKALSCNNQNQKNIQINCLNKNSQTEKPEVIIIKPKKSEKKVKKILNKSQTEILKDKIPMNTLKFYHKKLFKHHRKFHRRKIEINEKEENDGKVSKKYEEEKANIINDNNKNMNYSESCGTSQLNDNISIKYEMMEFNNKKNYVADKLLKRQSNTPYYVKKNKNLTDFHYIMKHPFFNNYFCSSLVNQMTYYNNNSYINDYSRKFENLSNPLNDIDLINKLHNLILNPNTTKIRNSELLLMYKNFPKGTFYGNKNAKKDYLIDKELKKLENTKYGKFVKKLNQTMQKAKEIQKELDEDLYITKNYI